MHAQVTDPVKIDPDAIYGDGQIRLLLGLTSSTIAKARRDGSLRYSRKGRQLYYRGQDVIAWLFGEGDRPEMAGEVTSP